MQALIDALYTYAQENQVFCRLQTPEYRQAAHGLEESWEAFRSTLTAEQDRKLDTLLSWETRAGYLEDKALLLAGISIGLDLGRL